MILALAALIALSPKPAELEKQCKAGKGAACHELGTIYMYGRNVERDDK